MKEWIVPAIGTFICWGLWGFLPKITTRFISPQSAMIYEALGGIPIGFLMLALMGFRLETHARGATLGLITGMLGFLGAFGFLLAVSRGKVSLVVSLTALYPAFSVALAMIVLREPLSIRQGFGVLLALIAMVLVAA